MILAGIGRYGPYVQHAGTYANLADADEVFDVGLNRAVTVLAEKRAGGGRGGRSAPAALPTWAPTPTTGEPMQVLSGRFGPYVNPGKTNANMPKGQDPATLTQEQAVALLAERAAKGGGKNRPARPPAPKAAAAKAKPAAAGPPRRRRPGQEETGREESPRLARFFIEAEDQVTGLERWAAASPEICCGDSLSASPPPPYAEDALEPTIGAVDADPPWQASQGLCRRPTPAEEPA